MEQFESVRLGLAVIQHDIAHYVGMIFIEVDVQQQKPGLLVRSIEAVSHALEEGTVVTSRKYHHSKS